MRVKREDFLRQLESVAPGLSTREIVEQSNCFVFQGGEVMTYNDEIAARHKCDLDIEGAVQSAPLLELIRKLPDDELDISVSENDKGGCELLVEGKRRKSGVAMEREVFLQIDQVEKPGKMKAMDPSFNDAASIVTMVAGRDQSEAHLTCVMMRPDSLEATDNQQLISYKVKTGMKEPTLVRHESLKHVVDLGMTQVAAGENWIHFGNDSLLISCRKFAEDTDNYPDISRFLKVKGERMLFPKGVTQALDKATIFLEGDDQQVLVHLVPGKMRVKSSGQSGWYQEVQKLKYSGEKMGFGISPQLLRDLVTRHNEFELCNGYLKVDSGNFTYVAVLTIEGED